MRKRIKASEVILTAAEADGMRKVIGLALAPIEAWKAVENAEAHLEGRIGLYVAGLEELLEKTVRMNDIQGARGLLNDLIRLTKIGRPKADINVAGISKLRDEADFSQMSTEMLRKALGMEGEN